MDDYITISAKTLDEAITEALLQLQTTSEHLYYEIVQKETSGVFGLFGGKPCIIRAKVMTEEEEETAKAVAAEKERMKKEKEEQEAAQAAAKEAEAREPEAAEKEVSRKDNAAAPIPQKEEAVNSVKAEKTEAEKAESRKPEKAEGPKPEKTEKKESRPNNKDNQKKKQSEKKQHMPAPEPEPIHEEKPRQPVKCDPDRVQELAKDFLTKVLGAMGMQVEFETSVDLEEGDMCINMTGQDMGILIGKRGQTLDSLQYLTSLVVNRETEGYLRVKLDTENYRERRTETLETLARNIAYKVKRTKRPVSLEPMNPYERRIIHSALQGDKYVVTRSEGEDPYRHVVISLRNDHGSSGKNSRYSSSKKGKPYDKRKETKPREDEGPKEE